MTTESLKQFAESVIGQWSSVIDLLSDIGLQIRDEWENRLSETRVLSKLLETKGQIGEVIHFDDDLADSTNLAEFVAKFSSETQNQALAFADATKNALAVLKVRVQYDAGFDSVCLFLEDMPVAKIDVTNGTMTMVFENVLDMPTTELDPVSRNGEGPSLRHALSEMCSRQGVLASYSDIIDKAVDALSGDRFDMANLSNAVDDHAQILGSEFSAIKNAISKGPDAFLAYFQAVAGQAKLAVDKNDPDALFNSTSITVRRFSAGAVVTTIGAVIEAVAIIAGAFNKLLGVIAFAAGKLLQWGSRLFLAASTDWESTRFNIHAGRNPHCFSFVVDQGTFDSQAVANYLRSHNLTFMGFLSKRTASMFYVFLINPYDLTSYSLGYEEHLSTDFDCITTAKSVYMSDFIIEGDRQINTAFWADEDIPASNKSYFGICPAATDISDSILTGLLPLCIFNRQANPSENQRFDEVINYCYRPINFNMWDKIANILEDEANTTLWNRLVSAMFIRAVDLLSYSRHAGDPQMHLSFNHEEYGFRHYQIAYTAHPSNLQSIYTDLVYWPIRLVCRALYGVDVSTSMSHYSFKSPIGLSHDSGDSLLTIIQRHYDALNYKNHLNIDGPNNIQNWVGKTNFHLNEYGGKVVKQDSAYGLYFDSVFTTSSLVGPSHFMWGFSVLNEEYRTAAWPREFAVDLPTLTFSGFILGLLVDGLVIAAGVVLSVYAVKGYLWMVNTRAKMQANVESMWYAYQDGEADWSQYKAVRLRYNIMAMLTGGTTLSMGLYDESDGESVIEKVKDYIVPADSEESKYSIKNIVDLLIPSE